MAASAEVNTPKYDGGAVPELLSLPMAAVKIWKGSLVAVNATGYATPAATTAGLVVLGRAEDTVDNSAGAAGDLNINVRRGVFRFTNSSSTGALTQADVGKVCYVVDDVTVSRLDAGTRPIAGKVIAVDSNGVWVETGIMSSDPRVIDLYLPAGEDMSSTGQYLFVKNSSGSVVKNDTAGGDCVGVLQNAPANAAIAIVRTHGPTSLIASGSINALTLIKSNNAGKSAAAAAGTVNTNDAGSTSDPVVGSFVMGRAIAAGTTDTAHAVLLHPMGVIPTTAS
jgi:hypothetical protein